MAILRTQGDKPHGVPRRGYVLSSAVEEIARHGRVVVSELSDAFQKEVWAAVPFVWCSSGISADRASWHVFAAWLTRQADRPGLSLTDTVVWYSGVPLCSRAAEFWYELDVALAGTLRDLGALSGHNELLPYVLETHGPGSRLSVMRDPATKGARTTKKRAGVFYTPPDVATFIVSSVMDMVPERRCPKVLDPAVGTGVFLRAALKELRRRQPDADPFMLARDCLFGLDIDPLALDGAASVLLADILAASDCENVSPLKAWQTLRSNLVRRDALTIDQASHPKSPYRVSVEEVFSMVSGGFDLIIGNPPYAELGSRADLTELARCFKTLSATPTPKADLYPAFVEQMVRLAAPGAVGGMVLPLSIACNSGGQFVACRSFIEEQRGSWRFSFFDRQPHALFGEDVKTRNAIILWNSADFTSSIQTGPLRRWRGDDRATMFAEITYTPVSTPIASGVPKFHGSLQAEVWDRMALVKKRLSGLVATSGRADLASIATGTGRDVYIAPTAYNFLGLARPIQLALAPGEVLSENPLHKLSCGDNTVACAVYAILGSNFAYWWWLTTGDGFHVNRSTLMNMPIGLDTHDGELLATLGVLGGSLWQASCLQPIRSVNRGRISLAFTPDTAPEQRCSIDKYLCAAMGLPVNFVDELASFTEKMRSAGLFLHPTPERLKELAA